MNEDQRSTTYELGRAFGSFTDANDERLDQIKHKGTADPITEMKVDRLNDELSRVYDAAERANRRSDRLETALGRSPLGKSLASEHDEATLFALERKHNTNGHLDVGTYRQYKHAFRSYLRKNNAGSMEEIKAIAAYYKYGADRIVAEVNQGGDMVEHTLRTIDDTVSFKSVHASRGKFTRAEPVAALDEQGRIHHAGLFDTLEDQMCCFDPSGNSAGGNSPDRVDARVWAVTELMLGKHTPQGPKIWGG